MGLLLPIRGSSTSGLTTITKRSFSLAKVFNRWSKTKNPCYIFSTPEGGFSFLKTKGYKAISTGIQNKPAQPGLRWLARLVALSFLGLLITACEREAFVMNSPPILVSPDEFLDFGELPLGYTATRKIQMVNAGGQPLSIDDYIALSDENVFMATFERETIAPGASVSVSITFTPAVEQRYEGVLRVKSNTADGEEVQVTLRGTGLSDVVCGDCESPPGDICEDDDTLLTYNRDGECAEDVCRYVKERIDCPYGCEAGICLGAVVITDGGLWMRRQSWAGSV